MERASIKQLLEEKGITATQQRIEMASLLLEKHQHLTAEDVNRMVNARFPKVSRATVFNNLNLFVEAGLIKKLELKSGVSIYDSNTSAHHHVIDPDSGKIMDVELDELSTTELQKCFIDYVQAAKGLKLNIEDMQIVVRGSVQPAI